MLKEKHLTNDDYNLLANHVETWVNKDTILVNMLMRTGMRQDELLRLTHESIDVDRCRVYVRAAKGSVSRWLPVDDVELLQAMREALTDKPLWQYVAPHGTFKSAKVASWRSIIRVFDTVFGEGMHHYVPHSLRHTFALRVLTATNRDLLKVQLAMGHKSINSTAIYLQVLKSEDIHNDILSAVSVHARTSEEEL